MNSVGSVPPLNPSTPIRSETWTDNLGRMGEERLAHVKELIEVGLGQRTPHFGQSNVSLRHFDDHLVITWEADGNYGRAWRAWSDPDVQAARSAMLEKQQQAIAADEKFRAAQSSEYAAKKKDTYHTKKRERREAEQTSRQAWNQYYESQHTFEVKYEAEYNTAPKIQKRLTFEIWLVFNINGGLPQNLPEPVAKAFDGLSNEPVNHFLRMQRSNYPSGETERPSKVRPPYPTDATAAKAVLEDIFLPKPRVHASNLTSIARKCAKWLFWLVAGIAAVLAIVAASLGVYVYVLREDARQRLATEQTVLDAINNTIERLVGQKGQDITALEQAKDALDKTARHVEGKINYLDNQIKELDGRLTLSFKGRGLDAAPCWGVGPRPESRSVRYLFKVELREDDAKPIRVTRVLDGLEEDIWTGPFDGQKIKNNYSSSFENPAAGFLLDDWISAADFSRRVAGPVNKVYAAQDADNSCRHYVRLCDHSYRDKSAASYKALLTVIGGTFYYYRPSPGFCGKAD